MTLFGKSITWSGGFNRQIIYEDAAMQNASPTLAQAKPGSRVKVVAFLEGLPAARQAHLQSYGLLPGVWVTVIQHAPVTVVEVDHLELAIERELAEQIGILLS